MKIANTTAACKAAPAVWVPPQSASPETLAVRFVTDRLDVSPYLARDIADLAGLGGCA